MPPQYVYDGTQNSIQYQLMLNPQQPIGLSPGQYTPCPDEYQPIALSIQEDLDDVFIEPAITATYFQIVDLTIGGQWLISDDQNRGLYLVRVATKRVNKAAGTVSYTFTTLMSTLARHEPAGVVISSLDAGLGETATPNEVLSFLFRGWSAEVRGLSLAAPVPTFELRGETGAIIPYVLFLSVQQSVGQSLSIRAWLERFFQVFEGYSYRLNGGAFTVLPPMYMQTESILLTPASVGTAGALVVSEDVTTGDAGVINSQTVAHRPYVFSGTFEKNPDGTPKQPSDLAEIAEPTYYRNGQMDYTPLPDNRRRLLNGQFAPYTYSEELYPVTPPVRVTWTAYVFGTELTPQGAYKVTDFSSDVVMQTHVVDIGAGRYFDAVTRWLRPVPGQIGGEYGLVWVWRLELKPEGVRAVLVEEPTVEEARISMKPPDGGIFEGPHQYDFGAEFHMNIQGAAWEKSNVSYSGTYGVYTPPTLPPGVAAPPVETASDAATDATELIYGRRPGTDKVIDIWSLVSQPATTSAELSEAQKTANEEALRELVSRTLLDIAQHAVKERLLPYETVTLTLMRPFPVTVADIGRMATYGERTGLIRSYGLQEAHTLTGSEVVLEISLRVPQTAERQAITFIPVTPAEPTPYQPPGYPEGGDFPGAPPPPPPEPLTAGPGMVQLDLGRRFDLLRLKATGTVRIRLYRTDAARTADAGRAETEVDENGFTVNTTPAEEVFEQLILEARLPYGNNDFLDLHSVLGHTPTGVVYANLEGGPVTFYRFLPGGALDEDAPVEPPPENP